MHVACSVEVAYTVLSEFGNATATKVRRPFWLFLQILYIASGLFGLDLSTKCTKIINEAFPKSLKGEENSVRPLSLSLSSQRN